LTCHPQQWIASGPKNTKNGTKKGGGVAVRIEGVMMGSRKKKICVGGLSKMRESGEENEKGGGEKEGKKPIRATTTGPKRGPVLPKN